MNDMSLASNWFDEDTLRHANELSGFSVMEAAGPMMVLFVFVEALVAAIREKKRVRMNDTINRYVLRRLWRSFC